jgi:O-antigen/teichoic acid export membrane protein
VLLVAFVEVIQECFDLNLGTAVIKFGADYRAENRPDKLVALVKLSLLTYAGLAVLSILAVAIASLLVQQATLGGPELQQFVILYAIVSATSFADSISSSLLRLHYRFRTNALVQMAGAFGDLALVTGTVLLFPRSLVPFLFAMIIAKLADSVLTNGAAAAELWRDIRPWWRTPIGTLKPHLKTIAGFALSNSGSRTLQILIDRGDVVLLGALTTHAHVGAYAIAKKLGQTVLRFTDPLTTSLLPQAASLIASRRIEEMRAMLVGMTKVFAVPAIAAALAVYLIREPLVVRLYGVGFASAADPFYIHFLRSLIIAVFFWNLGVVQSFGMVHLRFLFNIISLIVFAALGFAIVPAMGALGMAIALTVAKLSGLALMLVTCHRLMARRTDLEPATAGS